MVPRMTVSLDTLLAQYDYSLSPRDIAEVPASPRDSAKLLVYDRATGATTTDTFLHLDQHLPKGALLVFNDTRVVPARLPARTTTGGTVQLLWLREVGVLGSGDGEWSWFLLVRFLRLPFAIW